jgi:hypothetical protein
MHFDPEESLFSPVGAPGISSNPVLCLLIFIKAPADNWNLMIKLEFLRIWLGKDSSFVSLEGWSDHDPARDWAIEGNVCFHLVCSDKWIITGDIVCLIVCDCNTIFNSTFSWLRRRRITPTAYIYWTACLIGKILRGILHASRIRDSSVVSIFIDSWEISSIAIPSSFTIDNHLRIQSKRRIFCEAFLDIQQVEPIRDGWNSAMSPAWPAVLRNMFV